MAVEGLGLEQAVGSALVTATAKIASKNFDRLADLLITAFGKGQKSAAEKISNHFRLGFKDYIENAYIKVSKYKSLLSPNTPLTLKENYIHITLTCDSVSVKDSDLMKEIEKKKLIVIQGLAGSGKSMFMKHIALSAFDGGDGKFPLFVDLRKANHIKDFDIENFVRLDCSSKSNTVSEEGFRDGLKAGVFMLILDGFDEINYDLRASVEKQILRLTLDYPKNQIVVSSRPDYRFRSWTSFYCYTVDPLSKDQCVCLIEGLDYDSGVKTRFLRKINAGLYESHRSFLSSPLLTTIMLLTYEEFANIPDKMHAFYGQAFDTLFQKHDALKEQFHRKTLTSLAKEEFKSCFSAFCVMSYLEEKFSFDEKSLNTLAKKAIEYARNNNLEIKNNIKPANFVRDLIDSVCLLQQDGVDVSFVHRSFQEYFAAVFVIETHADTRKILDRFSVRAQDSVIAMALDMHREGIEERWVLPTIEKLLADIYGDPVETSVQKLSKILPTVTFSRSLSASRSSGEPRELFWVGFTNANLDIIGPLEAIRENYGGFQAKWNFPLLHTLNLKYYKDYLPEGNQGNLGVVRKLVFDESKPKNKNISIRFVEEDNSWLEALGIGKTMFDMQVMLEHIRSQIRERTKKKSSILEEFFQTKSKPLRGPKVKSKENK